MTSPQGAVTYQYDDLARLSSVMGPTGETDFSWEPGGQRLVRVSDFNLTEHRCYDGRGWLTSVSNGPVDVPCNSVGSSTGGVGTFKYVYDARGNRVSEQYWRDGSPTEVTTYGYDGADWLTGVQHPNGSSTLYKLGGDGTRIGEREALAYAGDLGPAGFDGANPLTKDWSYQHDGQGGLLGITDGLSGQQVASYLTDAAGQVTSIVTGSDHLKTRFGDHGDRGTSRDRSVGPDELAGPSGLKLATS